MLGYPLARAMDDGFVKVPAVVTQRNNAANGVKVVKPFMLVIARDTTHAGRPHAASLADARAAGRDCRVGEGGDRDAERRFAVILERDADKWFKPGRGQFQMFYKLGVEHPEYVPDFVVETGHFLLMVETNERNELGTQEVKAKAEAGALWCRHASDHARKIGAKPWKYLLIPHDLVTKDKRLVDFLSFESAAPVAPHNAMTTRSDGAR